MFLQSLAASALTLIVGGFVLYLLRERILLGWKDRLEQQSIRRERAAAVADLAAKWLAPSYGAEVRGDRYRWELQRDYWRVALWLDTETLHALNEVLTYTPGAGTIQDTLVTVRSLIVGRDETSIMGTDLTRSWPEKPH